MELHSVDVIKQDGGLTDGIHSTHVKAEGIKLIMKNEGQSELGNTAWKKYSLSKESIFSKESLEESARHELVERIDVRSK